MNTVSVIYGSNVQKMVQRVIERTGALDQIRSSDTVFVKPNLVVSRRNWIGVNTDPRVVEAIVVALKGNGVNRIVVGDGAGMGYDATQGFKICGYRELSDRYGLQLVDLEKDRFVKIPVTTEGPFETLEIAQTAIENDFFINVPVMKAHGQTLLTCSLKNLKGVMPRALKTGFHGVDLHRAIAQLAGVVVPELIIVDGIQGDLMSETGRTPVQMERILLGKNPVSVDSVAADMLGYKPRDIRHIAHSADANLGTCDLPNIRIQALNRPTKTERFTPPTHFSKRFPCRINAKGACCTCMGNLIFALERLHENGLISKRHHFQIGQNAAVSSKEKGTIIAVGRCAAKNGAADIIIDECPPAAGAIIDTLSSAPAS